MQRRIRSLVVVSALIAVVLAGLFGPERSTTRAADIAGGGELQYLFTSLIKIAPYSGNGGTAPCPKRYDQVGGGFALGGSALFPPHIYRSKPGFSIPPGYGWQSSAWNPKSARKAAAIRVDGVCLKRGGSPSNTLLYENDNIRTPPATLATAEARCKPGYQVVGGGFELRGNVIPDRPPTVIGTFPTTSKGWAVQVLNPPNAPVITVIAEAVCMKIERNRVIYKSSPDVTIKRYGVGGASVDCPQGSRAYGGGFDIGGELAAYPATILLSRPWKPTEDSPGWTTQAVNTAPQPVLMKAAKLRAFVVCVKD